MDDIQAGLFDDENNPDRNNDSSAGDGNDEIDNDALTLGLYAEQAYLDYVKASWTRRWTNCRWKVCANRTGASAALKGWAR